MFPTKTNIDEIIPQNNDLIKFQTNSVEQKQQNQVNEAINENFNTVQDIIEHFQQYSKRNSNNVYNNNNNNNNSEVSSPSINTIIQNLNNSQQKNQQTNFASITQRSTIVRKILRKK